MLSVPTAKKESRRLAGMQSLTAQWLQHEVRNLEERTARRATLGLYLVPDASVLINHLTAIKMLLSKPTHMIIIPQTGIYDFVAMRTNPLPSYNLQLQEMHRYRNFGRYRYSVVR